MVRGEVRGWADIESWPSKLVGLHGINCGASYSPSRRRNCERMVASKKDARKALRQQQWKADMELVRNWPPARQLSLETWRRAYQESLPRVINRLIQRGSEKEWKNYLELVRLEADRITLKEVMLSWDRLRNLIYERDDGICWYCGDHVPFEYYELGHLVDRVCGGEDTPDNLAVMCNVCNRIMKPLHRTIDEARAWRETSSGTGLGDMLWQLAFGRH